jgi:hypothetical protein
MRARAHTHTHTHQLNLGSPRSGLCLVSRMATGHIVTRVSKLRASQHVQKTEMIINLVTGSMATAASELNTGTLSY